MDPNGELLQRKPLLGTSVKRAGASRFEDPGPSITPPYLSGILECYPLPQEARAFPRYVSSEDYDAPFTGARADGIEARPVHLKDHGFRPRRALLANTDHGLWPPGVSLRA